MPTSNKIKGNKLKIELGAEDYWCDLTSVTMENEEADSDVTTFCDAADGGSRQYFFNFGFIQSTQAGSFWRNAWENSGTEVPFTYAPHGNETPTENEPHFTGFVTIGPRPTIGGEAGTSNVFTSETRWDITGVPLLDDGTETP